MVGILGPPEVPSALRSVERSPSLAHSLIHLSIPSVSRHWRDTCAGARVTWMKKIHLALEPLPVDQETEGEADSIDTLWVP